MNDQAYHATLQATRAQFIVQIKKIFMHETSITSCKACNRQTI